MLHRTNPNGNEYNSRLGDAERNSHLRQLPRSPYPSERDGIEKAEEPRGNTKHIGLASFLSHGSDLVCVSSEQLFGMTAIPHIATSHNRRSLSSFSHQLKVKDSASFQPENYGAHNSETSRGWSRELLVPRYPLPSHGGRRS